MRIKRITALDGLRGVAALMVLFHHLLLTLPDYANFAWFGERAAIHGPVEFALIRTPLRLLWAGQERALLFFVLSGFVLSLPWLKGRPLSYGRFLLNRFCRIYPPYLIAMALAGAGFALFGHPLADASIYVRQLGWARAPADWASALASIAAVVNNRSSAFLNEAMWSLVWEVRIALIFPLLMLPILRWGNLGAAGCLGLMLPAHLFATWLISSREASVLYGPADTFFYAQFFILGAAVAYNQAAITAWFQRRRSFVGPLVFFVGCLMCWAPFPGGHRRVVGVGAAIIIATIAGSASVQKVFDRATLIWLGRQSYSLYLIHVPLIMVVDLGFGGRMPLWGLCLVPALAIALAEVFHRWVEMPSVAFVTRLTGGAKMSGLERQKVACVPKPYV